MTQQTRGSAGGITVSAHTPPGVVLLQDAPKVSDADAAAALGSAVSTPVGPTRIAALAMVDVSRLDDAHRLTYLSLWQQALNWVQANHLNAVAAAAGAPQGLDAQMPLEEQRTSVSGSMAEDSRLAEIGATLRITPLAAKRLADVARGAATTAEPVLNQMLAGRWTMIHLRRALDAVENHKHDLAQAAIKAAVRRGLGASPTALKRRVQQELVKRDSAAVTQRIKANRSRRSVTVWAHDDFVGELTFTGSWDRLNTIFRQISRRAEQVLDVLRECRRKQPNATFCCPAAVDRATNPDIPASPTGASPGGSLFAVPPCPDCGSTSRDLPTLDQLRADALVEAGSLLAAHMEHTTGVSTEELTARRGVRWRHAVVVTDLATALGVAEEPGWVPGYGYVPADISRELLAGARSWQRFLLDDHGRVSGVGQHVYRPSSRLRDLVTARDLVCTFPGCERSAADADLDHRQNFNGSNTVSSNLHALCRTHHRLKTFAEWTVLRDSNGVDHWRSPNGRQYHDKPPDPPWPTPRPGSNPTDAAGMNGTPRTGDHPPDASSTTSTPRTGDHPPDAAGTPRGGVSPLMATRTQVTLYLEEVSEPPQLVGSLTRRSELTLRFWDCVLCHGVQAMGSVAALSSHSRAPPFSDRDPTDLDRNPCGIKATGDCGRYATRRRGGRCATRRRGGRCATRRRGGRCATRRRGGRYAT